MARHPSVDDRGLPWQKGGLEPPAAVRDATAEYLASEDSFGLWLSDATTRDPDAWESTADLFSSWASWVKTAGEQTGREKDFRESMTKHGFARARTKTTRGFRGVKLNRPDLGSDLRYAD